MIRYHSFYAAHREGEYAHLMNDRDRAMLDWVRAFNPYDLYSKGHDRPDVAALKPYYQDLIAEFFRRRSPGDPAFASAVVSSPILNRSEATKPRQGTIPAADNPDGTSEAGSPSGTTTDVSL